MNPTEQLAHFSGGTNDLSMTGLWYSHKRVAQLVEAARAEAGADLREQLHDALVRLDEQTRMTDAADAAAERRLDQSIKWMDRAEAAEATLARVRALVDVAPVMTHDNGYPVQAVPKADLISALEAQP